jgi:phosphopantothenoylcysteine decarboxylase/phosphopantothenate--cysteine ligase
MLKGKKILLGVSASIAAYKAAMLCRLLVKEGAEVQVIMTADAQEFIGPLTLATLSKRPVYSNYTGENGTWHNHVELGLWADAMVIAPATANTLAKAAHAQSDNLLLATYLSARCPVFWAPAMDLDMFAHPGTQANLKALASFGNHIIEPNDGELASGLSGKGRLAEPEEIVSHLINFFQKSSYKPLLGKKVMITAGPTQENLDPVRYITNRSTGKMGYAIAECAAQLGAEVTIVSGPVNIKASAGIKVIYISSALEMLEAAKTAFATTDIAIYSAAVADYRASDIAEEKIKKKGDTMTIELVKNPDVAAILGSQKKEGQILVGFALETENELENAQGKLLRKNLDLIVLNSLKTEGAGFGHDTNLVHVINKSNEVYTSPLLPKTEIAQIIWDQIIAILPA